MDIEAIVKKYAGDVRLVGDVMRAALTEQAEAYEQRIRQLEAERVPEGMTPVPTEILDRFPELNMCNYGHDDVSELNAWGVELVLAAAPSSEQRQIVGIG